MLGLCDDRGKKGRSQCLSSFEEVNSFWAQGIYKKQAGTLLASGNTDVYVSQAADSSKETGRSACGMQNARLCNRSSWMEGVCSQRHSDSGSLNTGSPVTRAAKSFSPQVQSLDWCRPYCFSEVSLWFRC